jgi:cytochrome b
VEARDIADLFVTAIDKIEFYWNFYTVTLLALIGWLVTTKQALDRGLKLLLSVGYLIFVAMNLTGLWGSYTLAEALRLDLLAATADQAQTIEHARNILAGRSMEAQRTLAFVIHGVLAMLVLGVIWLRRSSPANGLG